MKFFASILALYIVALSLLPCSDINSKEISFNNSLDNTFQKLEHSSNQIDSCSPFCFCNCCGTIHNFVLQKVFENIQKPIIIDLPQSKIGYKSSFFPQYFGGVWRPPKVYA